MSGALTSIPVTDERGLAAAVRQARREARACGFSAAECCTLATAVSELAMNILRYAGRGELRIERAEAPDRLGLRIEALDDGPGIADPERALEAGYSTGGSLGLGLPAVRRATDELAIESRPGAGTRVRAIKWRALRALEHGFCVRPLLDPPRCGDAVWRGERGPVTVLAIIDVLGHGAAAHVLAERIVALLEESTESDPEGLMRTIAAAIRGSRGAALGLCALDRGNGTLRHCAIGNTVTRICGRAERHLVSRSGVVGGIMPAPRAFEARLRGGELLLMYSDGVRDRFTRADLGTAAASPRRAACAVVRRFGRRSDDAACLAARFAA